MAVAGERGLLWSAGSKGSQMALYGVPESNKKKQQTTMCKTNTNQHTNQTTHAHTP